MSNFSDIQVTVEEVQANGRTEEPVLIMLDINNDKLAYEAFKYYTQQLQQVPTANMVSEERESHERTVKANLALLEAYK